MHIQNLANIELLELTESFNAAFSDYSIPMYMTAEQLQDRFITAGISYELSFGAFDREHRLVAFVMHCVDQKTQPTTVFNVGTGVVPKYRGLRLVQRIYEFATPILTNSGISACKLEVIQSNEKAIKAYQSAGFTIDRELSCFRGVIRIQPSNKVEVTRSSIRSYQSLDHSSYWNYPLAWENTTDCIIRAKDIYTLYLVKDCGQTCGYAIVHSVTGLIKQFGIQPEKRRSGYGQALFHTISQDHSEGKVLNIDSRDHITLSFLQRMGLKPFVEQYEMHRLIQ